MKKLIALLCAFAVCFSLASCGKESKKDESVKEVNAETTEKESNVLTVKATMLKGDHLYFVVENNLRLWYDTTNGSMYYVSLSLKIITKWRFLK